MLRCQRAARAGSCWATTPDAHQDQLRNLLMDLRAPSPTEEIIMRHALITFQLMNHARDTVIAQGEADERLEHQARAMPRAQPADLGRLARVVILARRVRALTARTS
jgi:hypothetical protein